MANSQKLANKNVNNKMKKLYKTVFQAIDSELTQLWLEMMNNGGISSSNLLKANRYNELRKLIETELRKLANQNNIFMQESLIDTYLNTWLEMYQHLGVEKELTILDREVAKQVVMQNYKGANFSERIWSNMTELRERIHDSISMSAVAGVDVRKVAETVKQTLNASYSDSKRITITETSRVFNESCRNTALNSGLFETYHLLMENNACPDCQKLKDEHFPLTQSILPVHPYCKCTMIIDM